MCLSPCMVTKATQMPLFSMTKRTTSKRESSYEFIDLILSIEFLCRKDEFTIECPSVGEINKILIAHNNKGSAPGWFLDRIIIEDLNENRIYEFPCNKWLATNEDDGQISRYLFPKKKGGTDQMPTGGKSV